MGDGNYLSSGVFVVPTSITTGASIEVYILNTDDDERNKAEVRVFNLTSSRVPISVIPLGKVKLDIGREQTFSAPISSGGVYEVEVYLEDQDNMDVNSVVEDPVLGVIEYTRIQDVEYKRIKQFL